MTYIPVSLRRIVSERSGDRCEYCLRPQWTSVLTYEVDHIIAESHGGDTVEENLCLACPRCNRLKGSNLSSIDPVTKDITPLFNPRKDVWREHFLLDGALIAGKTNIGRTTVRLFNLNAPEEVSLRQEWIDLGIYP